MEAVMGAVLAAGAGTRMGMPKASLLNRAVTTLLDGGCSDVIAVVRRGVEASSGRRVDNDQPETGMRGSQGLAIDTARAEHARILAVMPVDMPGLSAEVVATMLDAYRPDACHSTRSRALGLTRS